MKKLLMLAAFTALSTASLRSTVMLPMFMDDLTESSQTVVYGSIAAKRAEWNPDHSMINTVYTVEPREYVKGALGSSFEISEPGGELNGEGFYVASAPQFEIGEEAVLFVWTDRKGHHQVTALDQGAVKVEKGDKGVKTAARKIPLGSSRVEHRNSTLVSSASEAAASQQNIVFSEQSLSGLLNQIRVSVSRTRLAAE
jgi:hypothetical protein